MKALLTTGTGPYGIALGDRPDPVPGATEVLVAVEAVGVNRGELARIAVSPAGAPLGWDVYGHVVRPADDGSGPPAGTPVVGLSGGEGWAELAVLATDRLAAVPEVLGSTAAALPVAGLTARYALRAAGPPTGRTVAITGAGGGVGRIAVQLAAVAGARTIALVGDPSQHQDLAHAGADVVAAYGADTGPVDVLLDSVGGEALTAAFDRVRPGGVVVAFGNSSRAPLQLPPTWARDRPGVTLRGLGLFDEITRQHTARDLEGLVIRAAAGRLDPNVVVTTGWEDAPAVLQGLNERRIAGKAVLLTGSHGAGA
ncbi:NADP-dependent oxidoreductase [Pseudonocardia ailaonensis]|uniref:NADP-dependent oxidoreductase n=1 Tax=Pseudonocardia ailaonensis TaxID=367279 RepID=A0ABN2N553_9PSEU